MKRDFRHKITDFFIRFSTAGMLIALILLALGLYSVKSLKIDGDLAGFQLRNDSLQTARDRMAAHLSTNQVQVLIIPENTRTTSLLASLNELESQIQLAYPNTSIQSISSASRVIELFNTDTTRVYETLKQLSGFPLIKRLIASDQQSFLLLIQIPRDISFDQGFLDQILETPHEGIQDTAVLSRFHIQSQIEEALRSDLIRISALILLLFAAVILLAFRNIGAVLFCSLSISFSMAPVFILFNLLGYSINLVTILALPVVLILSVADSVHLLTGLNRSGQGSNSQNPIRNSLSKYVIPSALTSFTTGIAFLSFLLNDSQFIREFGLLTGLAVIFEFLLSFLTAPVLLKLANPKAIQRHPLQGLSDCVIKQNKWFSLALFTLLLVSLFSIPKLRFQTSFDLFFPKNSQLFHDHNLINDRFYSILDVNLLLSRKDRLQNTTPDQSDRVAQLIHELQAIDDVVYVSSYLDAALDSSHYLINMKVREAHATQGIYREIQSLLPMVDQAYQVDVYSTALYYDQVNKSVASSLLRSLSVSFLAIFLILYFLVRKAKYLFAAVMANLIPLGAIALIFNVFHFDINITTAITLVVCLGIIVDDTIHVLYRKLWLKLPLNELAFGMTTSSLLLSIGFLTLLSSSFSPTRVFGLVSSLVIIITLISDLSVIEYLSKSKNSSKDG